MDFSGYNQILVIEEETSKIACVTAYGSNKFLCFLATNQRRLQPPTFLDYNLKEAPTPQFTHYNEKKATNP
jgi:hypothetical protein